MKLPLPIDGALDDIARAVAAHGAVVVSAPPGSGKTTRLPAHLVDIGTPGQVVVLEPRRLAARAAARRVAEERGGRVGEEVGYRVRHDERSSARTRLCFVTEGMLVRRLCKDPFLEGIGAVVLDEFHERHVDTDLALAMVQEVRETVRDDLRIVVMSATLDADPIARFLGGCPVIRAEGRSFAVEIVHLGRPILRDDRLEDVVRQEVHRALHETAGHVLVFLPGIAEIQRASRSVAELEHLGIAILPLHGALSAEQQDLAIAPSAQRKVVLATNVAESSVTIDGVTAVVDSGLVRVLRHDPSRGFDALRVERISAASATQRAGRAGRTAPGRCYRLWSTGEERTMPAFETPELRRVDLAGPALIVRAFAGRPPRDFGWFDPPDQAALEVADAQLERLGALDAAGRVTPVGFAMLRVPLHPRLARVLLEGERLGCHYSAAEAAALLAERDLVRPGVPGDPPPVIDLADRLARLHAVEDRGFDQGVCRAHGVDRATARAVVRAREQIAGRRTSDRTADPEALARAVLAGFFDRVVRRRGADGDDGVMVGGRGVRWPATALAPGIELFVALEVADAGDRRTAWSSVRLALPIERSWLDGLVAGEPRVEVDAEFDAATGRAVGLRRTMFLDLVLEESRGGGVEPDALRALLVRELRGDPWRWLGGDEVLLELLARARWLRAREPSLALPEFDDAAVVDAAAASLTSRRTLRELRDAPVAATLIARLTPAQRRALEVGAPERVLLPSGRRASIAYRPGPEPVLAVRMQELFGARETPRIAGGRVPVLLHLLAPNQRPVQVTTDLASFWANVYPKIRSELRRRYPKHSWPEDPLTAAPEARPGRPRRD